MVRLSALIRSLVNLAFEIAVVQRIAKEAQNRHDSILLHHDTETIIRFWGFEEFNIRKRYAFEQIIKILSLSSPDMKFSRLLFNDGIETVFCH